MRTFFTVPVLSLLLSLAASITPACAEDPSPWDLGPVIGLEFDSFRGVEARDGATVSSSAKLGFSLRYRAQHRLGERWRFETSLGFSRRASELKFVAVDPNAPNFTDTEVGSLTRDRVEVPLLARYHGWTLPAKIELSAFAGPTLALNFSSEFDVTAFRVNTTTGENTVESAVLDAADAVATFDVGGVVGLEFSRPIADVRASLILGYGLGLNTALEATELQTRRFDFDGGRAQGFALGVSASFGL